MFRKVILIIFLGICLLIATSYFFLHEEVPETDTEIPITGDEQTIDINGIRLAVEIADEPYEQSLGLSYRESLGQERGMLFVFPESSILSFWMKDMNFALDMLWINGDGVIIGITKNISPDTYPQTFQPPSPVKYVLEVNAGWSDRNNIKIGDPIKIKY